VAGAGDRQIFAEETFPEIYRYTGGVPRLINTLCDTAMMAAYGVDRDYVLPDDITSSVQELRWVEFSARVHSGAPRPESASATGSRPALPDISREIVGRLLIATEGRTLSDLPLRIGRLILGRTPDNDIQIDSRFVSRHHCQIITTAQGSVVEDLNSTNGILVQGKRVRRHNLNDGDVVMLGKHELMYVDERLPARRGFSDTVPGVQPVETGEEEPT
jgi:general secretion pathway protein A